MQLHRTRGKFFKRFFSQTIFVGGLLWATAAAQPLPEPPVNSEVAIRILPTSAYSGSISPQDLADHPVYRLIERLGNQYLGFAPLKFVSENFEGTFVGAIASPKGSGLKDYFEDRDLRRDWSSVRSELESLTSDLNDYAESEGVYPEDLPKYLEEVRYYEPYLPASTSYQYRRVNDGKGFELRAVFAEDSALKSLGPAPVFFSSGKHKNLNPVKPAVPLNIVMGAKLLETSPVKSLLSRALGAPKNGFWSLELEPGSELLITLRGNWLVASDRVSNLGGFLKSLNGEVAGWSANPAFKTVTRNLQADSQALVFVDLPKLAAAAKPPSDKVGQKLLSLVGPMGYSVVPYTEGQFRVEVFLGVTAPKGSQLQAFLNSGNDQSVAPIAVANIPWDVSNVFAFDYGASKELLDGVVALFPDFNSQFEMGQDVFLGMLGLDAEAGFDGLLAGPTIVSFERIDVVTNALDAFMDKSESGYGAEASEGEEEASEGEEEVIAPKKQNPLGYVPATFAFQIPVAQNRQAAENLLAPYMGDDVATESLYGVEIKKNQEGNLAYAVDGDWMYVSGGRTDRLMKHMLEAAHGRKETLSSIDSWTRFTVGTKGRLIGFGHQKVDAIYSLVKGVLLLLGSEFRPAAVEVGRLRDYHSIMTAVPDGFMFTGEIVQGDGR